MKLPDAWRKSRTPLVGLAISAAVGIIAADWQPWPIGWVVGIAFCLAALALRWGWAVWPFVMVVFALVHQERHWESSAHALSLLLTTKPQAAVLSGIVEEAPQLTEEGRCRFPLRIRTLSLEGRDLASAALVMAYWKGPPPRYGDKVQVRGFLLNVAGPRNPGEFDYAAYLQRRGIYSQATMRDADGTVLAHDQGNALFAAALNVRGWMQNALRLGLGDAPAISGLIQSMTLGIEDDTPPDMAQWFRETGTMHLFAVSGMNVTLFATILWIVLRPFGLRRGLAMMVIVPSVIFYAMLTGLSASGVRAALMALAVMGAYLSDRKSSPLNHLAAAALLIFLWDTEQLFMPGFQLSFGVVLALFAFASPLQRRLNRWMAPDPFLPRKLFRWPDHLRVHGAAWLSSLVAVTLAAWLGSSPLGWWYFHMVSPVSVAANLLAVPTAVGVMALGATSILAALCSPGLAAIFNNANWVLAQFVLLLVHWFAALPGSHFYVAWPEWHPPKLELIVFDFERGGAIQLRTPHALWLLDTGSEKDFRWTLRTELQERGVNRLDGLWITNAEGGRMGGAPLVCEQFRPSQLIDAVAPSRSQAYRAWQALMPSLAVVPRRLQRGAEIRIDDETTIRVLYPPADLVRRRADDRSYVLQVVTRGMKILLMSDSGFLTETYLLEQQDDLHSDVLVKGMNTNDLSGLPDFIARVDPRVVVSGYDNFRPENGLSAKWVENLTQQGIALFRQDETGAVTLRLDAAEWQARAYLTPHVFTNRAP